MKKLLSILLIVLCLESISAAFAATPTKLVAPPSAVGTYNDFGQQIRLDIYVKNTNASQYKIYYAPGYKTAKGFKSFYVGATPNYTSRQNQQAVRTGFLAPVTGWWTVEVVSVGKDGKASKPFITNVYVLR